MPLESRIQHSRVNEFVYDWQTAIAGIPALAAGTLTVVVTMIIARRQIDGSRAEADRANTATRAQTEVTRERCASLCRDNARDQITPRRVPALRWIFSACDCRERVRSFRVTHARHRASEGSPCQSPGEPRGRRSR